MSHEGHTGCKFAHVGRVGCAGSSAQQGPPAHNCAAHRARTSRPNAALPIPTLGWFPCSAARHLSRGCVPGPGHSVTAGAPLWPHRTQACQHHERAAPHQRADHAGDLEDGVRVRHAPTQAPLQQRAGRGAGAQRRRGAWAAAWGGGGAALRGQQHWDHRSAPPW